MKGKSGDETVKEKKDRERVKPFRYLLNSAGTLGEKRILG
jgi:hypothetical protein